eukprot:TRINITY_DN250_c0_g1_i5.p1 TRINITY_DN250_c0_g1~~TRINITY_DN250_c0_g1_i5.p1  ORF type:complete len:601 (+),score=168.71 TRINITY_DN250_c0_g1_i5:48-1850(+)
MRFLHNWLISKLALPDDDEVMVKRKTVLLWFFLAAFFVGGGSIFTASLVTAKISAIIAGIVGGPALVWLFVNKKPSDTFIELVGYADLIGIIFTDLNALGAMNARMWPIAVLVVDVFLVCRIRSRSSIIVVTTLCLWLFVATVEQSSRFGLLDIGGSHTNFNGDNAFRFNENCNCTNLPCGKKASKIGLVFLLMVAVFLLDYYFTRGFADEVLAEKRKLELGVLAARDVASFLAGFKLEEADAHLDLSKEDLPDKLHEALHTILVNLRSYKPYLPQSCLRGGSDSGSSDDEESTHSHTASHTQSESLAPTPSIQSDVSTASRKGLTQHVLTSTRATMLVMNMKNSIELAEAEPVEFSRLHAKVIGFALHAVRAQKGMLDLFVGDHVHASFNASRKCVQHAVAAVKTATTLKQGKLDKGMEVNVAVCGGKVLVGDLGNNEVRRFSIMGNTAVLTSVYERLGAEWGIGVVCNTAAYMDASVTQEMRIVLKAVTFVKHNHEQEAVLWEVVSEEGVVSLPHTPTSARQPRQNTQQMNQEWMYELDESRAKYWVKYNEAAKLYLQGHGYDESLFLLTSYKTEPVAAALSELIAKKVPVVRQQQVY